ncbi:general odorant-binding protein 83a-like isoform X1 [Anoplophora glabripennis]|nr:general odorant-binding protein 83a-like isoform X1 [Anoplophora glabripennis]
MNIVKMKAAREIFFIVGVCVALISGMSDEMKDLLDSLHAQCLSDSGVNEELISKAQKGEFEEDEKLKCYMRCIFDETGLFGDDGKIDVEGMVSMLPDEIKEPFAPTVRKCGGLVSGSPCEQSFKMYKCCFDEAPQYYFLP